MEQINQKDKTYKKEQPMSCRMIWLTILVSLFGAGYLYCVDILQTLQLQIRNPPYSLSSSQYNLTYFYTFLGPLLFIIPLGIFIDHLPLQFSIISVLTISVIAQFLQGLLLSTQVHGYLIGFYLLRSIFGLTGQAIFILKGVFTSVYAKQHYETIMAYCMSIPMLFQALETILTTEVYIKSSSIPLTIYVSSATCLLSLIAGIIIVKQFILTPSSAQTQSQREYKKCNLADLKNLTFKFWMLMLGIFFTIASTISFIMNGTDIIVKCYGIAYESTGFLVAGLYIIRFCFSIGIAKLCAARPDWRRGIFITICILFSASLIAMYFLPLVSQPTTLHYAVITVFFIMLSMSLSSLTALSTLVSNLVPAKMTGTAWAIVSVAIDVCECVMSLSIIWLLNDNGKTLPQLYQNSLLFFFIVSLGNVVVSLVFLTPEFEVFDYTLRELEEGRKQGLWKQYMILNQQ